MHFTIGPQKAPSQWQTADLKAIDTTFFKGAGKWAEGQFGILLAVLFFVLLRRDIGIWFASYKDDEGSILWFSAAAYYPEPSVPRDHFAK